MSQDQDQYQQRQQPHQLLVDKLPFEQQKALAKKSFALLDCTSLSGHESIDDIRDLCVNAVCDGTKAAAICIYAKYIAKAIEIQKELGQNIPIATVVNFPLGNSQVSLAVSETESAVALGADEIDIVFPYKSWLEGDRKAAIDVLSACRTACNGKIYKVILETGAVEIPEVIQDMTQACVDIGVDFVKTSTGKNFPGATIQAVQQIIQVLRKNPSSGTGLKISGGLQHIDHVMAYFMLIDRLMGPEWIKPSNLRLGASRLTKQLRDIIVK